MRLLDLIFSLFGLVLGLPVLLVVLVFCIFDTGSPIFLQERVGRYKKTFTLIKFRTMKVETASMASHLADAAAITRLGAILRRTKLDELPQLWNVLKGEMSLVGPRPCLLNQLELIEERQRRGVFTLRPGITGPAQLNNIDMSTPVLLAQTDAEMLPELTFKSYFKYVLMTIMGKGYGDRIKN